MKTIEVNTVLFTKDGRMYGNAIVTKVNRYVLGVGVENYSVTTDYGNKIKLTESEILNNFYLDSECEHMDGLDVREYARLTHKNAVK